MEKKPVSTETLKASDAVFARAVANGLKAKPPAAAAAAKPAKPQPGAKPE